MTRDDLLASLRAAYADVDHLTYRNPHAWRAARQRAACTWLARIAADGPPGEWLDNLPADDRRFLDWITNHDEDALVGVARLIQLGRTNGPVTAG